ncbi:hypothetical protein MHU86_20828 [Fragilaria crotonensis]|nr:hypothetical protein MHU86_20828 [Fragilaria crotonensis]
MANPAPTRSPPTKANPPSAHSGTNTFTPKKSTNKAPGDFQRAHTALTPQQSPPRSRVSLQSSSKNAPKTPRPGLPTPANPPTKQDLPKWVAPILFPTQTAPPTTSKPPNPKRQ